MRPLGGWIFGYLADTRGRRFSMIISVFLMCGGSLMIAVLPTYDTVGMAAPVLLLIAAFYTPVTGVLKADLYPATVRALGVGLPYAIGNALCGGTAEYVALMLRGAGVESVFYYYVAAMSAITLLAAVLMPDLRKHGYLDGCGAVEENTGWRSRPDFTSARN